MPHQFLVDTYETECIKVVALTIYAYDTLDALFKGEANGGAKAVLPNWSGKPVAERPVAPMAGHQRV